MPERICDKCWKKKEIKGDKMCEILSASSKTFEIRGEKNGKF